MVEAHTQYSQKINVLQQLLIILLDLIFGIQLTGEEYSAFFELEVNPEFTRLFPDDVNPYLMNRSIWLQEYGAPPHYYRHVLEFLDVTFPNHCPGRRGTIEWPARSPDLTPLDLTDLDVNRPQTIEELKDRITE